MLAKVMAVLLASVTPPVAIAVHAREAGAGTTCKGIIAINVLLLPDERLAAYARDLNQRLLERSPEGFMLDASHVPHISLVHRYVRCADLPKVLAAVERIATRHDLGGQTLNTSGLTHAPWQERVVTSIRVEKTPPLAALQGDLVAALRMYSVARGTRDAFMATAAEPHVDDQTIEYVRTFVDEHTGERYQPHVTVGISDNESARWIAAQPAHPLEFTVDAMAVYQLGDVGAARKELWRRSVR
jgi:hypothetical protein